MPPDMAVSMRHTKLKAEEAALLAGEINKPSWESKNEGIHERISFEDSIWGFDLAGGSYYKTPLRVTYVKPDSRADKAGIRAGDKLLTINDIDTSTLTIQEAHAHIIESGIHLRLKVTSPEDEEDAYYCYEDPLVDGYDSEEERRLEEEKAKKRIVHAKVSSYWSLQWPWVSKRRLIYRESNCFMVNSKYEEARRAKYPPLPVLRYTDDILLYQKESEAESKKKIPSLPELKEKTRKSRQQKHTNGDADSDVTDDEEHSRVSENRSMSRDASIPPIVEENDHEEPEDNDSEVPNVIEPVEETGNDEDVTEDTVVNHMNGQDSEEPDDILSPVPETEKESPIPNNIEDSEETEEVIEQPLNDDDMINEVLGKSNDSGPRSDEDNILDSILSDDGQNLESSEANNER